MKRGQFKELVVVLVLLAALVTLGSVVVTKDHQIPTRIGTLERLLSGSIAFDSSYPTGGEDVSATVNLIRVPQHMLCQSTDGYMFEYDATNKKIKVFQRVPPIVFNEPQTIASNAITLKYPPAYIMSIGSATATIGLCNASETLTSNLCAPTAQFTFGTKASFAMHANLTGAVYTTYVTQAWKEVFDNLVWEEAVDIEARVGTLDYQAIAIQNAKGGATLSLAILDKDDSPATGEVAVDMTSTAKTLTLPYAEEASLTCTYIKKPSSGFLYDRFVAEEALTNTAGACYAAYPILLWGYGCQLPVNAADTRRLAGFGATLTTAGTIAYIDYAADVNRFNTSSNGGTPTAMYVWGRPWEINTIWMEVPDGTDLSALTAVKFVLFGQR